MPKSKPITTGKELKTFTKLTTAQKFELMKMASEMCTCPHTKIVDSKEVIKTYNELVGAISN